MLKKLICSVNLTVTNTVRSFRTILVRYSQLTSTWVKSTLVPFLILDIIDLKDDFNEIKELYLDGFKKTLLIHNNLLSVKVQNYIKLTTSFTNVLPFIIYCLFIVTVLSYISLDSIICKLNLIVMCGAGISFYVIIQTILLFVWGTNISLLFKTYVKPLLNVYM